MLSAGGQGTSTTWTAMHESPTELVQNVQCRMATASRLGMPPGVGPRGTCPLRKGNEGEICEQSLEKNPYHLFSCKYGGARARLHLAVMRTLHIPFSQAGGYADMERHVLEVCHRVKQKPGDDPALRCAIWTWSPGFMKSCSSSGSMSVCGAHMHNVAITVRRKKGSLQGEGERRRYSCLALLCLLWVFETYGRLSGESTKLQSDLVTQCSPHAVGRWRTQLERVLMSAQTDTSLRALGSRVCAVGAAERPTFCTSSVVGRVERQFFLVFHWRCFHATLVRSFVRQRQRPRQRLNKQCPKGQDPPQTLHCCSGCDQNCSDGATVITGTGH